PDDLRESLTPPCQPRLDRSRWNSDDQSDLLHFFSFHMHEDQRSAVFLIEQRKQLSHPFRDLGALDSFGRSRARIGERLRDLGIETVALVAPLVVENVI